MSEIGQETRIIKRVGAYSTSQAEPEDCKRCHNATYGTVLIDGLCLDCFMQKTMDGIIVDKFQAMCEESLNPHTFTYFEIVKSELEETRHIPNRTNEGRTE